MVAKKQKSEVRGLSDRALARLVARALFVGGYDTPASRLVMERDSAVLDGSGWSERAVVAVIQHHLEAGR